MMPMWNKKVTKKIYNHPNLLKKSCLDKKQKMEWDTEQPKHLQVIKIELKFFFL